MFEEFAATGSLVDIEVEASPNLNIRTQSISGTVTPCHSIIFKKCGAKQWLYLLNVSVRHTILWLFMIVLQYAIPCTGNNKEISRDIRYYNYR